MMKEFFFWPRKVLMMKDLRRDRQKGLWAIEMKLIVKINLTVHVCYISYCA